MKHRARLRIIHCWLGGDVVVDHLYLVTVENLAEELAHSRKEALVLCSRRNHIEDAAFQPGKVCPPS
eukprot:scaffold3210_cov402-Prasinococcus_capsulatus_cf.AAC.14